MNSNNIVLTLVIVIVIIIAIAIITYVAENHGSTTNVFPVIRPNRPSHKIIGGCAGTRWGCCPDGKTARTDKHGKNCG